MIVSVLLGLIEQAEQLQISKLDGVLLLMAETGHCQDLNIKE